ncbi:immunoglobulin-like domain-containing protein [Eubacterium ventriosum]
MKRKILFIMIMIIAIGTIIVGCGKKSLANNVTLKTEKIKVGENIKLDDLFKCEKGIKIGFKNSNEFNTEKVGTYSIESTITDGEDTEEHTYLIEVYDDEKPDIQANDVTINKGDIFEPLSYATCTDNSNENIKIEVKENEVNVNKPGIYKVVYSAVDSSGNFNEKEISVVVKKTYTYKSLKKQVKSILKKKKYDQLKMSKDDTKEYIWISLRKKLPSQYIGKEETLQVNAYAPYWALEVKDKKVSWDFYVEVGNANTSGYLIPQRLFMKSSTGKLEADGKEANNANYGSKYPYIIYNVGSSYYYDKSIEKLIDLFYGNNITIKSYFDKRTFTYKVPKKNQKAFNKLADFYKELNAE